MGFWATRWKRMLDNDDFWAIRGKKSELENYLKTKRGGLKPNGLFSSIKRSENSLKRNFKPNGLFSTFKRALRSGAYDNFDNFDDEDEFLYDLGNEMEKREDFWAARG